MRSRGGIAKERMILLDQYDMTAFYSLGQRSGQQSRALHADAMDKDESRIRLNTKLKLAPGSHCCQIQSPCCALNEDPWRHLNARLAEPPPGERAADDAAKDQRPSRSACSDRYGLPGLSSAITNGVGHLPARCAALSTATSPRPLHSPAAPSARFRRELGTQAGHSNRVKLERETPRSARRVPQPARSRARRSPPLPCV